MRGSGGSDGGLGQFVIGLVMSVVAVYLFFDSVLVRTDGGGMISGMMRGGRGQGGIMETTSMGILFIPFFLGVFALFVNAKQKWAWGLTYIGLGVLAVEILSRIRFVVNMKLTHLGLMLVLFAAGCAFMFRSYREDETSPGGNESQTNDADPPPEQ